MILKDIWDKMQPGDIFTTSSASYTKVNDTHFEAKENLFLYSIHSDIDVEDYICSNEDFIPKTMKDLMNIGKPFVIRSRNSLREFTYIPTGSDRVFIVEEDREHVVKLSDSISNYIVDWFDQETVTVSLNSKCTCDFYKQVMPYGCNCGGT